MKKGIAALLLSMTLTIGAGTVFAAELPAENAEAQVMDMEAAAEDETADRAASFKGDPETEGTGTENTVYSVTIKYDANGGKGEGSQLVSSDAPANLAISGISRKDYTLTGWNTKSNGKGTAYKAGADLTSLATEKNNGSTITLYAQWKLNAPKLKKVESKKAGALKISFSKINAAKSYELQYSTAKNFKKKTTVKLKKGISSTELFEFVPNKKYFIRMRSYDGKQYSDWSNILNKKTKNGKTLANIKCSTGIEADITLKGSGSGCHAKLVLQTPVSAVSYGIQYDKHAVAPYTGKAMALIENIGSNAAGGQRYDRPGNKSLKLGKKYHMTLIINSNGKGSVYLDYKKIGSFSNPSMANQAVYPAVEGAVRLSGDKVEAVFENIRYTRGGVVSNGILPGATTYINNKGIKVKRTNNENTVTIKGTGKNIKGDWDSDYNGASSSYMWN
ncbi:MAG: InlB B-repeat-containing protein [Roseburia sp.]|nr:InlB B-repeat-containing protein [Roseburia sp.]